MKVVATVVAELVPIRVMVPALLTRPWKSGLPVPPLVALITVRLLLPVMVPVKTVPTVAAVMPMVSVPVVPVASTMDGA